MAERGHFLFLGYSLRDWNFRVMLYRLWKEQVGTKFKSWDVRGVDILLIRVANFVVAIEERLPALVVPR